MNETSEETSEQARQRKIPMGMILGGLVLFLFWLTSLRGGNKTGRWKEHYTRRGARDAYFR